MKQRIVGALVLIALAVIVVPIVLDFRKDDGVLEKSADIPPKPKDVTVQVLPLIHPDKPDETPPTSAENTPEVPPVQAQATPEVPLSQDQAPQSTSPPPADTVPKQAPSQHDTAVAGVPPVSGPAAWAVQVGSFSNEGHAAALRDQLRAKHFTAYVEKVTLDSGKSSYRVRVGPQLLRSDAEKTQRRLKQEAKLSGIVVSH